jgi:hypothetical protein
MELNAAQLTCVAFNRAIDAAAAHDFHSLVAAVYDDAAVTGIKAVDVHSTLSKH